MKIAYILGEFPAISQTFILNQITGLIDLGHEVKLFVNQPTYDKKEHSDIEKYKLVWHNFYFDIPENKIKRFLKAVYLFSINFHKEPVKMLKSLKILKYGRDAFCLRLFYATIFFTSPIIFDKDFDIIHCHFGELGNLGLHLRDIGVIKGKLITTFHGHDANKIPYLYPNIYNNLFKDGDLFTTNTNFTKNQIIKLGCDEKKIVILPAGLKIEKFKFHTRKVRKGETIKILSVARLGPTKGHKYTIKAISKIVKKYKNIEYIIAGDGPLKKELKELINKLRISNYVKFLGQVEENEVLELYKQAHIFIQPSVTTKDKDREGQVLTLQEAQATGLPVISTFHNGIPEGVINGKSAFLVPEKDSEALAERINYLIENTHLFSKMGKEGRKFVEKKYDIKRLNKKLEQIYFKLIKK